MFRRITHLFLAFVLLVSTTGFTVSKHDCSMDSGELMLSNTANCCVDELPDCCYTKTEYVHLATDFIASDALQLKRIAETDILYSFVLYGEVKSAEKLEKEFISSLKLLLQIVRENNLVWLQSFRI